MAIYYPSSTDQRDASATPFLQEPPSSTSYNELSIPPGNMMMYINQGAPSSSYMEFMSEHSLSQHDCVDMATVPGGGNGLMNIPTSGALQTSSATGNPYSDSVDEASRKIPGMELNMLNGDQNVHTQGLSLSLSTEIQSGMAASSHYQYSSSGLVSFSHLPMSAEGATPSNYLQLPAEFSADYGHIFKHEVLYSPQLSMGHKQNQYDPNMYNSFHTKTICDSRFLKAAQQLLDEVVSVQDALKKPEMDKNRTPHQTVGDSSKEGGQKSSENATTGQNEASSNELSLTVRQELQNKKSKLMSMLEEVDRRFSQYYHQMHVIVSSFDLVAGSGAAKPYTKLALQTISRHFRCLRDAIVGQIQVTRRSLGEQDTSPNLLGGGIPRLRYVDQQIRQQRGLHQLGVSRHSWRPQRGLPESSVTILRAWLFEHFLHPYPKESEKVMLARQTGLTRGQVANWFINARVRLWKPMVEEMYKEEFGESETISMSSPDRCLSNARKSVSSWASIDAADEELQRNLMSLASAGSHPHKFSESTSKPDFTASVESTGPLADFFRNRSHGDDDLGFGLMKFEGDRRHNALDHGLYHSEISSLNQDGDGNSLAQDSQVSLGLGVTGTRP
uniref:Homeobox domain-containing protein n=1 Tax=Kalanchoe fedtschenkoi TaxID=63787 RepID=A0A7N0UNV7_KALFE